MKTGIIYGIIGMSDKMFKFTLRIMNIMDKVNISPYIRGL